MAATKAVAEISPEVLIGKIQEYPYLYDPSRKDYKDAKKKENAWVKLGKEFKISRKYICT